MMRPWYRMRRRLQGLAPAQHGSAHFSTDRAGRGILGGMTALPFRFDDQLTQGRPGGRGSIGRDDRLPGNGSVEIVTVLAPGTWQLAIGRDRAVTTQVGRAGTNA